MYGAETLACIATGDQNRPEGPGFFACSRPTAPKGSLVCPQITRCNHSLNPPSSVRASYAQVWHTVLSHWAATPWARGSVLGQHGCQLLLPRQAPLGCVALSRHRLGAGAGLHAPEHPLGEVCLAPVGGRRNACGVATHELVEPQPQQVQDRDTVTGTVSTREKLVQPPVAPGPLVQL